MRRLYFLIVIFLYFIGFFISSSFLSSGTSLYDNFIEHIFPANKSHDILNNKNIKSDLNNIVFVGIDEKFFKNSGKNIHNINLQDYNLFLKNIVKYNPKNILISNLNLEFSKDPYVDYFFLVMKSKLLPTFTDFSKSKNYQIFVGYDNTSLFLTSLLRGFNLELGYNQLSKNSVGISNGFKVEQNQEAPIGYKLFLKEDNIKNYDIVITGGFYKIKSASDDFFVREIPIASLDTLSFPIIASLRNLNYISIQDLLNNKADDFSQKIRGKNVFLGINSNNLNFKSHAGNISPVIYDINSYLSIKNNIYIRELSLHYGAYYIAFIFLISLLVFLLLKDISYSVFVTFIFIFVSILFYNIFLLKTGYLIPLGKILLILLLKLLIEIFLLLVGIYMGKTEIKGLFKKYVGDEVLDHKESESKSKSESRNVYILFTDIEGFTSLSEKLSPEQTIEMLNIYFTLLGERIEKTGGFIDKYIGDSIMAFWTGNTKADDILNLALELESVHVQINEKIQSNISSDIFIKTRMGLHYGNALVGDVGNLKGKISYTIIGDNVNLASRLEGANKFYKTNIMFSDSFHDKIEKKTKYPYRMIDKIAVKGKNSFLKIYQLITDEKTYTAEYLKRFETGILYYINGDFNNAFHIFCDLSDEIAPHKDPVCEIMKERVRQLKNNPEQDWEGFWRYEIK